MLIIITLWMLLGFYFWLLFTVNCPPETIFEWFINSTLVLVAYLIFSPAFFIFRSIGALLA